jgi:hypothetical protein
VRAVSASAAAAGCFPPFLALLAGGAVGNTAAGGCCCGLDCAAAVVLRPPRTTAPGAALPACCVAAACCCVWSAGSAAANWLLRDALLSLEPAGAVFVPVLVPTPAATELLGCWQGAGRGESACWREARSATRCCTQPCSCLHCVV